MKRIAFILMVLCTLSFNSCSYDNVGVSYNENAKRVSIPSPIESFIDKFIVMEDSRYVITASLDDALSLGLTEAQFMEISQEIEKGNQMIAEIVDYYSQCEDVTSITIIDLNKAPTHKEVKAETRADTPVVMPSGNLYTIGQEQASNVFWAPTEMTKVSFDGYSYTALAAVMTYTTKAFGAVYTGTKVGNIGGPTLVPVGASNTFCTVIFQTTDSTGGKCFYQGSL